MVRRFKEGGGGDVVFFGGGPGGEGKDLVGRVRGDPEGGLFLFAGAGGPGGGLEQAPRGVDLGRPAEPAGGGERRRAGDSRGGGHGVGQGGRGGVVNLGGRGTIEGGMLSVLKFKGSLFAGVRDGGERDVFLGGSRLNKFMESVEKATAAIPPQELLDDAEEAL